LGWGDEIVTAEEQHKFWTVEMSNVKTNENNFSPRMPMIYDFHMICQDTINIKIKNKIEKVCNKNICKAYKQKEELWLRISAKLTAVMM